MTLGKEIKMWLEKQRVKTAKRIARLIYTIEYLKIKYRGTHDGGTISEFEKELDEAKIESDLIIDRMYNKGWKRCKRQYFHIPGQESYVHGSNLLPPYYEFMKEYSEFLKESENEI